MANHRPKSLSELNNVYDKAMRAERAIKEGSSLLSTPEPETAPETAPESENIFEQLETKAAQAQKSQVFDPDITNIANDFLKRYAQPEKPKAAPQEIKRPAPSIQVYHTPAKEEPEPEDVPLSTGSNFTPAVTAPSVPVYKPAHDIPPTREAAVEEPVPAQEPEPEYRAPAPQVQKVTAAPKAKEPTPAETQTPAKAKAEPRYDHTPRPAARVRITSTERSELMEEYMRVMSDDDDEPSHKKSVFSFFKKRKKHDYDEIEEDNSDDLYDGYDEENDEDTAEEVPVVPFDSSDVKYEDEYSNNPEEDSEAQLGAEPMNLYDYIEADFDYAESDEEYEEDEDAVLDVSFMSAAKIQEDQADMQSEAYAEAEEITEEPEETDVEVEAEVEAESAIEIEAEADTEEVEEIIPEEIQEEVQEEEVLYPAEETQETEEAEDVIAPEEEAELMQAPTAGMVFEDIFSVTDESKRSHTGGNWTEVFGDETAPQPVEDFTSEIQVVIPEEDEVEADTVAEADTDEAEEVVVYPTEETEEETAVYENTDDITEEAESQAAEETEEAEEYFDDYDAPKKRTGLRIVMAVLAGLFLAIAGATAVLSAVIGVDSGKIFSDNLRAFSVPETIESIGVNKGDLVITENVYAQTDNVYVYVNQADGTYAFGKVTKSSSNAQGDYLYVSETKDGLQLINRDTSMGVVVATYGGIGSVLAALCNYSIYIIIALVVFAIALIVCFVIITRKRRLYEEASAIYDRADDNYDDSDEDEDGENNNDDDNYYGDYDTDGIEQGLFNGI